MCHGLKVLCLCAGCYYPCQTVHTVRLPLFLGSPGSQEGYVRFLVIKTVKSSILPTWTEEILELDLECSCSLPSINTNIIVMATNHCWCWEPLLSHLGCVLFGHLFLHQNEMQTNSSRLTHHPHHPHADSISTEMRGPQGE